MAKSLYLYLLERLHAMIPLCQFGIPELLCGEDVLYYRNLYEWTNKTITEIAEERYWN